MNPWLEPWKPFAPVMGMNQVFPLVDSIPVGWQIVFAVILVTLLIIYYICLIVRVWPWHVRKPTMPQKQPDFQQRVITTVKRLPPKDQQ